MLKHESNFDFFLCYFRHLPMLYFDSLTLIEPYIRETELTSFNERNENKPAKFINYLIIFFNVVSDFLSNADQDSLGFNKLFLVVI